MKKFLAIYLGTEEGMNKWKSLSSEEQKSREKQGINEWHAWGKKNADVIVDMGAPLGKTKKINAQGITDTKNALSGYTIVRAESHEAAAALFLNHPHFSIFPGDSVEIMECLAIPEMK